MLAAVATVHIVSGLIGSGNTEERRARVRRRNEERGETFAVYVRDDMFDSLAFEPPGPDELEGGVVLDT